MLDVRSIQKRFSLSAALLALAVTMACGIVLGGALPGIALADDATDSDELFAAYAQQRFDEALPTSASAAPSSSMSVQSLPADSQLTDDEKLVLAKLKELVKEVAAGKLLSTEFTLSSDDLNLTKASWTASELGLDKVCVLDNGNWVATSEAMSAAYSKSPYAHIDSILTALLAECPYELYWYDKTRIEDGDLLYYVIPVLNQSSGEDPTEVKLESLTIKMHVVSDYAGADDCTINSTLPQKVETAINNASTIVSDNAANTTIKKLAAYRDEICKLVTYDDNVMATDPIVYGDPFQLISVFDGDSSTNVVCEGYAKAFQYLCDLSGLQDANCYTVTGQMQGGTGAGQHMWNIVRMNDNCNYLVDVTNCDKGTIGEDYRLFMACKPAGSVADGYTFTLGTGQRISYVYDDEIKALFSEDALTISSSQYVSSDPNDPVYPIDPVDNGGSSDKPTPVVKLKNTMTVKAVTKSVKAKKLKKKKQTISGAIKVKNAKGTLTFAKVSGSKKFTINKTTGKITVKKGTKKKKKPYKIKVRVTAKGNANYLSASKVVTLKIKVK